jgi:RNA polymerase sigma-70 factor (ECF subfamily)
VVALRAAIDLRRGLENQGGGEPGDQVASLFLNPELAVMKAEHRSLMEESLRMAFAALAPKERNVLRMYFAEGWTLDRIGKSYRVHRATVARWMERIRAGLLEALTRDVGDRLGLDSAELRSLAGLFRSQVEASFSQLGNLLT